MNRRTISSIAAMIIAILGVTSISYGRDRSVSIGQDDDVTSCDQLNIRFDQRPAAVEPQEFKVAKDATKPLRVVTEFHGGIVLYGGTQDRYTVKACKAAVNSDNGRKLLQQIKVAVGNGEVKVDGPAASEDWLVYFIIEAPKDANVHLTAVNAPISIRGFSGRALARTTNGPIAVKGSTGMIDAKAVNGPVAFRGSSGDVTLRAENGPIDIEIESARWQGAKLDAHTENGPVQLHLPVKFESAALVETSAHSPFQCRAEACGSAKRTWDDNSRRIEFGGSSPVVKVSNVNGPVSIVDHKGSL
jgi:hypothetical protein